MDKEEYLAKWTPERQREYPFLFLMSLPHGTRCYWTGNGTIYIYPWDMDEAVTEAERIIRNCQKQPES